VNNGPYLPFTSIFAIGFIRVILFIILVILLYNSIWFPAVIILFLLIITESAWWWSKLGLKKLTVTRELTPRRLFPGEKANLHIKINNNKMLPIIIQYKQKLPQELSQDITKTVALKGYASKRETSEIPGLKRGYYPLPELEINSRDGLGLYYSQFILRESEELFIYPEIVPLEGLGIKAADLIGERADRRPILPDPLRVAGLRDYTPEMPARLIHWKASINKDHLLAKLLEPSADIKLLVAVDAVDFFAQEDEIGFEKALSKAASLAVWADENRVPFGLVVNASQKGLLGGVSIPINQGPSQTTLVLEKLARLEFNPLGELREMLQVERNSITWGTTLIIISKSPSIPAPVGIRHVVYL